MPKYVTKQRKLLLGYLEEHADEPISAQEIEAKLGVEKMSLSAVYRNLADLEAEGKVRRSSLGPARETFFQFIDGEECKGAVHMSCKKCGRTYHMDPEDADRLVEVVRKLGGFELDKSDTVLYGVCDRCGR